ncbi:hypothetical protein A0H81_09268 [Grifola frondosa]|uniref:Uncharacterized protein n=1 Tax=Grifola frondosa TaxID=5627 RepID=A0A1C7M265_GRIFR|nr:hypothetical protein A0H81_09268 [Grifola frondosa]
MVSYPRTEYSTCRCQHFEGLRNYRIVLVSIGRTECPISTPIYLPRPPWLSTANLFTAQMSLLPLCEVSPSSA